MLRRGVHTARERLFFCFYLLTLAGIKSAHGSGDVRVVVKEGSDAVLPCSLSTKESIEKMLFDWRKPPQKDDGRKEVFFYDRGSHYNNGRSGQSEQFKGRVSHFKEELKHGNASIMIRNTKLTDSGNYTCDFPYLQSRPTFLIELIVEPVLKDRSGENKVATLKPSVTILDAIDDWAQLQCEVQGASPKPHLQWQDSAGNKLPAEEPQVSEREGRNYITLKARVTKTDRYSCVVTQEEINHQTHAETFVSFCEKVCVDIGWLFFAVGVGAFAVLLLPVALNFFRKCLKKCSHRHEDSSSNQGNGSCKDPTEHPLNLERC